jgi:hypothetical protein
MIQPSDEPAADDPKAVQRFVAETCDYIDRTLREGFETSFGVAVDDLKTDPELLEYFLRHNNPKLRASAIVFASFHYNELGWRFRGLPEEFAKLARDEPDREVRHAAISALSSLYSQTRDRATLAALARLVLDPGEEPFFRKKAYMAFTNATGTMADIPGALEAFFKFQEVLHRDLSDYEFGFVRSALKHLGLQIPW